MRYWLGSAGQEFSSNSTIPRATQKRSRDYGKGCLFRLSGPSEDSVCRSSLSLRLAGNSSKKEIPKKDDMPLRVPGLINYGALLAQCCAGFTRKHD
jgi:hypothetical protein